MRSLLVALLACVLFSSCNNSHGRTPFPAPLSPSGLQAVLLNPTEVALFWLDLQDEDSYELERAIDGGSFVIIARLSADTTVFEDLGLTPDTLYCYRIRANNEIGDSPLSGVVKIFTDSRPPVDLNDVQGSSAFHLGGMRIRLIGRGYLDGGTTTVTIGGEQATDVNIVDDTTLICTVPGVDHRDAGVVMPVVVSNDNGTSPAFDFTYFQWGPIPGVLVDAGPIFRGDQLIDGRASMDEASDPTVCSDGLMVYSAWEDDRTDSNDDIYFNRSTNGGRTWMANATRISDSPPGMFEAENVELCCNGMTVHAVWPEKTAGASAIYYRRSTDGGVNWEPVIRLDTAFPTDDNSSDVRICCDGDTVAVCWRDFRFGTSVFANVSTDGGASFAGEQRVDTNGDASRPEIACAGGVVHVVWDDDDEDAMYSRSADGGQTFSAPFQVNTGGSDAIEIEVCAFGDAVHAVYTDDRDGGSIRYNRSLDGGLTWLTADVRVNDANAIIEAFTAVPEITCDDQGIYVVWRDYRIGGLTPSGRGGPTVQGELFFNRSLDFGQTWLTDDIQLSFTNGTVTDPHIACGGGSLFVVWQDSTFGKNDITSTGSVDGGLNWLVPSPRIAASAGVSTDATDPAMSCDGARIHVVWEDRRDGRDDDDVYYAGNEAK